MQMRFKKESGYITLYMSLVFAIFLSLLLSLVEGAAIGAARLQAELVADLGMDSVFAEYHRELFWQYGLLFMDNSYGTGKGSVAKVEEHLADYMSYNLNPGKGLVITPGSNWVKLENIYLEIEEAAFAVDDKGAVWKAQAIDYIKSRYGLDLIQGIQEQLQTIEKEQLLSGDLSQTLVTYQEEFEKALKAKGIYETNQQTGEGFSYDSIRDVFDRMTGKGILYLTIDKPDKLSSAAIEREQYIGYRAKHGMTNQGAGLPDYVEKPDGIVNELLFQEFILEKYGSYLHEKEDSCLKYQIEYILYGRESDISNLRECAEHLFLLRGMSNYLYLTTVDTAKVEEVELVAMAICTLLGIPDAVDALSQMLIIIWAMAESVYDVKSLLEGGEIPLIKKQGEWNLGLTEMLKGSLAQSKKQQNMTHASGISYEGYLRIFLSVMLNQNEKVMRSMDIAEMDIRNTPGNENFRIDQCIDYLKVSFGFRGDRGQEYVFARTMRYE